MKQLRAKTNHPNNLTETKNASNRTQRLFGRGLEQKVVCVTCKGVFNIRGEPRSHSFHSAAATVTVILILTLSFFFGSFFIVVPQPPSQQILFFSPSPVSPEKNGAAVVVKFFFVSSERLKIVESVGRSGEREIKKTKFSGGDEKPKNRLFHQNVTHFADCFDVESFRSVSHLQIAETISISSCSSRHQRRSNSLPSVVGSIYSCRCASKN